METSGHLPLPDLTEDQRQVMIRWLYAAADREFRRRQTAARAQDRARRTIRADAFRDAVEELSHGQ
jgi:hypothetical protein